MQTLKVDPIVQLKNLTKSVITRTLFFQQKQIEQTRAPAYDSTKT